MKKVALTVLAMGVLANAQTLSQIVEGIGRNGSLEAQTLYAKRADALVESAKSGYLPKLETIASLYKKGSVVAFEPKEARAAELRASYEIFDGFKRDDRVDSLSHEAASQRYKAEFVKDTLVMESLTVFYSYFDATADIEALEFRLKELDSNIKKLEVLVSNELATRDTLEAMNASKKEAEYQKESAESYKEEARLRLELLSGLKIQKPIWGAVEEIEIKELKRKDIEADGEGVKALESSENLHTYLPSLAMRGSLKTASYSAYDDMGGIQKQFAKNAEAGMELSWTIFDYGMIKKEREAAKLQTLSAAKTLAYKKEEAKTDAKAKESALKAARARLKAADAALLATSVAYEFSKKRFDANLIGYTDFLTELAKKESAMARAKRAKNEVELSKAKLSYALGADMSRLTKGDK